MTAKKIWRRKITLAAIAGLISGAARALATWALDHLH
jgi:hypothetical protein